MGLLVSPTQTTRFSSTGLLVSPTGLLVSPTQTTRFSSTGLLVSPTQTTRFSSTGLLVSPPTGLLVSPPTGLLVSPTHLNTLTETRYYKYKSDQILTHSGENWPNIYFIILIGMIKYKMNEKYKYIR